MANNAPRELPLLYIEDLEYIYRPNFSGEAERYNEAGNRYFNAKVNPEIADALSQDGWNIKWSKPSKNHPNPEEFVSEPYVEVTVGWKYRPPVILMIRDDVPTPVTERNVSLLDATEFEKIDVTIRAVRWENENGSGYKAWLKSFYGTVAMDDLDRKYAYLNGTSNIDEGDEN